MHTLIANHIYMVLQYLRGEPFAQAQRDLRKTEYVSLDELLSIQAKRQIDQLRFVLRNVPYYQKVYSPFNDEIQRASSWDDVNKIMLALPIVEKEIIKENPKLFTASNNNQLKTYPDRTSGSSGSPLVFPCDQASWAYRHALIFRCLADFGVKIGEPYAYLYGLHWNKRTRIQLRIKDWILNRVRISAFDISPEKLEEHLNKLLEHKPTYIIGYPSAIYDLCVLARDHGYDHLQKLNLKAIFFTSEPLLPYQRELVSEITSSRCVDMYGSAEGGTNILECSHGSLHIQSEATWVQLRDSNSQCGEILVTDMMLRAFPMIRYAIGDDVVLKPGRCSCGRSHPMVQSIEGRSGDPIILPNGRRINSHITGYIFKPLTRYGVIRRYRFVYILGQDIKLYIVPASGFTSEHLEIIKHETSVAFGKDIVFSVQIVDKLDDLPNAKHRDYLRFK